MGSPVRTGKRVVLALRKGWRFLPRWSLVTKTRKKLPKPSMPALNVGPQWSPVTKTRKTADVRGGSVQVNRPQWSPVTKSGKTGCCRCSCGVRLAAVMEPGHQDRETEIGAFEGVRFVEPQWSPVTKTGKLNLTRPPAEGTTQPQWSPITKIGRPGRRTEPGDSRACRNGARSRRTGKSHGRPERWPRV